MTTTTMLDGRAEGQLPAGRAAGEPQADARSAPTNAGAAAPTVAILVPCYNEAVTIAAVVADFQRTVPGATVYVFDNNSTDGTAGVARGAGAVVSGVRDQGKGSVIRRMFADIEADVYVLVDGDDTYDATAAQALIDGVLIDGRDMVVGTRRTDEQAAYRAGHRFGNWMLTSCAAWLFGRTFTDMLSGYRAFSRRFVKSFPAHASGFEIETELTVHTLELRMPVAEIDTVYRSRPEGSESKLNTYRDGFRILLTILRLLKAEKPLAFFSVGALLCGLLSVGLALPLLDTYLKTGLVPRLPTAVLSVAIMLAGAMFLTCGIVLDTVTRGRSETKRFAYLAEPGPLHLRSRR
ncbi:glycosyltransferase [Burkholderia sp. 22PA0106]|uniref:glycosyltransferase n=1 Tax=Burkholderia sp. 22PA0106 TaxID=3237371 RepID=UPI0039C2D7FA